jgi:capsule polysaccharide export protein KpsE/RkpR
MRFDSELADHFHPVRSMTTHTQVSKLMWTQIGSTLLTKWKLLLFLPLAMGAIAIGISLQLEPVYTARTVFLPPQQAQSATSAAAAALMPLGALAGVSLGRTPGDQYVSFLQSLNVGDQIIDAFKLHEVYGKKLRTDVRKVLNGRIRVNLGKRDGLITLEVDDVSPARASEMANKFVDELRRLTSSMTLTDAQQRRVFFEKLMVQSRESLDKAQVALQSSGFNQGALQAEPRSAAEGYARLRAEVASAEVRLQTTRARMADNTPEVQAAASTLSALRSQLARVEQSSKPAGRDDYVSKFREYKYQETLFDLFAKNYESARVDESREGVPIQVIDIATPPEKPTSPRPAVWAVVSTALTAALLILILSVRTSFRHARRSPALPLAL